MSDAMKICPADEVLLRWLRGQIDPRTGQAISQHLKECEVCADVVEGLRRYKRQEVIEMDLAALEKRISKLVKPNFRVKILTYAAAAIILVATGIIWVVYSKQLQQQPPIVIVPETPEQKKADVLKKADTTQDQLYAYNTETKTVAPKEEIVPSTKEVVKTSDANKKAVRTETVPASGTSQDDLNPKQTESEKEDVDNAKPNPQGESKDDATSNDENLNEVNVVSVAKRKEASSKKESESKSKTKSAANENYAKSDYDLIKEADAYAKQGRYADAVETLDKVSSNKSSPYYEESLWQKAQAQKAQGKKNSYKRTLKQIVDYKGKYAEKAKALLEE